MQDTYKDILQNLHKDMVSRIQLEEISTLLSDVSKSKYPKSMFLAYSPKSASSFFLNVLKELSGYSLSDLSWGYSQNEQNLHLSQFIKFSESPHITKLSLKATDVNLLLLRCFALKPVVISRSVSDSIISFCDHCNTRTAAWPQFSAPTHFLNFSREKQLDILIDHFVPWHIDFLESWGQASASLGYEPLVLSYDDITKNTKQAVQKVSEYYDIPMNYSDFEQVIHDSKSAKHLFNKGEAGRGKRNLTTAQMERLQSFFKHYPHLLQWI